MCPGRHRRAEATHPAAVRTLAVRTPPRLRLLLPRLQTLRTQMA
jgi:hypothetical protein